MSEARLGKATAADTARWPGPESRLPVKALNRIPGEAQPPCCTIRKERKSPWKR